MCATFRYVDPNVYTTAINTMQSMASMVQNVLSAYHTAATGLAFPTGPVFMGAPPSAIPAPGMLGAPGMFPAPPASAPQPALGMASPGRARPTMSIVELEDSGRETDRGGRGGGKAGRGRSPRK